MLDVALRFSCAAERDHIGELNRDPQPIFINPVFRSSTIIENAEEMEMIAVISLLQQGKVDYPSNGSDHYTSAPEVAIGSRLCCPSSPANPATSRIGRAAALYGSRLATKRVRDPRTPEGPEASRT